MADVEHGAQVVAGPITFMIEHRTLVQDGTDVSGPTIRVLGTEDEHEYLRFDMFNTNAHYHYEPPSVTGDEKERVLPLDTVAEGEPVAWAMDRLRGRLAPMLTAAGGSISPTHSTRTRSRVRSTRSKASCARPRPPTPDEHERHPVSGLPGDSGGDHVFVKLPHGLSRLGNLEMGCPGSLFGRR